MRTIDGLTRWRQAASGTTLAENACVELYANQSAVRKVRTGDSRASTERHNRNELVRRPSYKLGLANLDARRSAS